MALSGTSMWPTNRRESHQPWNSFDLPCDTHYSHLPPTHPPPPPSPISGTLTRASAWWLFGLLRDPHQCCSQQQQVFWRQRTVISFLAAGADLIALEDKSTFRLPVSKETAHYLLILCDKESPTFMNMRWACQPLPMQLCRNFFPFPKCWCQLEFT